MKIRNQQRSSDSESIRAKHEEHDENVDVKLGPSPRLFIASNSSHSTRNGVLVMYVE